MPTTVFGALTAFEREFIHSLSIGEFVESHQSGRGFHGITQHLACILPGACGECEFFVDFVTTYGDPSPEGVSFHFGCSFLIIVFCSAANGNSAWRGARPRRVCMGVTLLGKSNSGCVVDGAVWSTGVIGISLGAPLTCRD